MRLETDRYAAWEALVGRPGATTSAAFDPERVRVLEGPSGLVASAALHPLGGSWAVLGRPVVAAGHTWDAAASLIAELVEAARGLRLGSLGHRALLPAETPGWRAALAEAGFRCLGERREYGATVADLPDDHGSPFTWADLSVVGEAAAADALAACAAGDPHFTSDDPVGLLRTWLADDELTSGPACVEVGTLDGAVAAFVMAQAAPSNGFARITYLGLVPAARGRGLGGWVHRRGFVLLGRQGGVRYRGGTAAANPAMVRLFERHGCGLLERMSEWELHLGDPTG